jgi:hypothetical protein
MLYRLVEPLEHAPRQFRIVLSPLGTFVNRLDFEILFHP